jgi:hypothetical protein
MVPYRTLDNRRKKTKLPQWQKKSKNTGNGLRSPGRSFKNNNHALSFQGHRLDSSHYLMESSISFFPNSWGFKKKKRGLSSQELVFADEALPPWVNHNGKLHPLLSYEANLTILSIG